MFLTAEILEKYIQIKLMSAIKHKNQKSQINFWKQEALDPFEVRNITSGGKVSMLIWP